MFPRQIRKVLPFLALVSLCFVAGAKKPQVTVRFHLKAAPSDAEPFVAPLIIPGAPAPISIKKIPEISELNIAAIYPFPAGDGTFGCAFKLDFQGTLRLDTSSTENRGRVMVALFNGRLVTAMLVDKKISDGIITIPSGLTQADIDLLAKKYPLIGAPPKKKR